jgi:hypothetical protein
VSESEAADYRSRIEAYEAQVGHGAEPQHKGEVHET